jgi:hypothetical protein
MGSAAIMVASKTAEKFFHAFAYPNERKFPFAKSRMFLFREEYHRPA